MNRTIGLECEKCGSNRFTIAGDVSDDAIILCEDCGESVGTLSELKEEASRQALDRVAQRREADSGR